MVRKRAENGTYYHEPPYTWEEEQALYRSTGGDGPFTVLHGPHPPQPERKGPPEQEEPQSPS